MSRSIKLSVLVVLALGSSQVMALDVGQIQVKSALGQPLLADIPLSSVSPAELKHLTVQLASSEEFARAGIAGGRTSIPLQFSVVDAGGGNDVIRVTSTVVVNDPYIDLLLELDSGGGKSTHEFPVLLDPASMQAAAPASEVARAPQRASHVVARPSHAEASKSVARAATGNGQYGPVAHGQTLSAIARNVAPSGADINQVMLALKQDNPGAFYHDNINALKSGAILRVPTSAEAQAVATAAAVAEVRRENSDWRTGAVGKPTTVADAATRSTVSSAPSGQTDAGSDRLALVQAKDVQGAGGKGEKATANRQELLRTQEGLASAQQQSSDLKTRLQDLTDINNKNTHLLALKDSEIAELQSELAAARKAGGGASPIPSSLPAAAATAEKSVSVAASAPNPASALSSASTAALPLAASSVAKPVVATSASAPPVAAASTNPAPAKPVVKHHPIVVATPPADEPWYTQTWAWIVGAVAVLGLLFALLGRRRKAASEPKSSTLADHFTAEPGAPESETDSYDRDQSELLDQLAEHPDDVLLHLELVTLYYSRRDVDRFEAAAEAMHAHIDSPQQDEWQDVLHMGEDLAPEHPLFRPAAVPAVHDVHDEAEARHAFDLNHYAAADDVPAVVEPVAPLHVHVQEPKKVSEYNYKFDLTPHAASESLPAPVALKEPNTKEVHTPVVPAAPEAHQETESLSSWHFDEPEKYSAADSVHAVGEHAAEEHSAETHEAGEYNDDPVDTKLDLARAYLDMGDPEGARSMLSEVLSEGTQMQRDVAKHLMDTLH